MIRRKPLRRAPWPRRQPDQPRARGRATASPEQWQAIRDVVLARAGWRCQACGRGGRLDVHHVVKRSQGGSDWDLDALVALCRRCHAQTDAPFVIKNCRKASGERRPSTLSILKLESKRF